MARMTRRKCFRFTMWKRRQWNEKKSESKYSMGLNAQCKLHMHKLIDVTISIPCSVIQCNSMQFNRNIIMLFALNTCIPVLHIYRLYSFSVHKNSTAVKLNLRPIAPRWMLFNHLKISSSEICLPTSIQRENNWCCTWNILNAQCTNKTLICLLESLFRVHCAREFASSIGTMAAVSLFYASN